MSKLTRRRGRSAGITFTIFTSLLLGACSGGGGSAPLSGPFDTAEYRSNPGLAQINALSAYEAGATGAGATVAVVDTGVQPNHVDLQANLSSDSIDITDGGANVDFDGHGTAVAGVVAAVKNDFGVHGVAFNSSILAVKASDDSASANFSQVDVAAGVNYAVAHGADVINLSLGGAVANPSPLRNALVAATAAGVIVVASVGNTGNNVLPEDPAAFAGDADMNGLLIAVGAVDSNNNMASFSNKCGDDAEDFCIFAPGVAVPTTGLGGGLVAASGTSFSAPHVSGAAALLLQAFPSLTSTQVVDLLLTSAADLGATGVDDIFGRGLVNLRTALAPLGVLSVPTGSTVEGDAAALDDTGLSLGPAFGDALAGLAFLDRAIILDAYQRPYRIALGNYVTASRADFNLDHLLAPDRGTNLDLPVAGGINLAFGLTQDDVTAPALSREFSDETDSGPRLASLSLTGGLDNRTRFGLGYNLSAGRQIAALDGTADPAGLFWTAEDSLAPQARLIGPGDGFGVARRIAEGTRLSLAWLDNSGGDGAGQGSIGQARLSHRFRSGAELAIGFANVTEDGAFLGSEATGAFGLGTQATSRFYTLQGRLPLGLGFGLGLSLIASYTAAEVEIDDGQGALLHDFDTVRADAFGLGIVADGVFAERDRLGFLAGQPLRVFDADARLTLPVERDLDGNVTQQSEQVTLTPSGREIDLQIAYRRPLPGGFDLSSWAMMQLQPGHDQNADPGYAAGLKLELNY